MLAPFGFGLETVEHNDREPVVLGFRREYLLDKSRAIMLAFRRVADALRQTLASLKNGMEVVVLQQLGVAVSPGHGGSLMANVHTP